MSKNIRTSHYFLRKFEAVGGVWASIHSFHHREMVIRTSLTDMELSNEMSNSKQVVDIKLILLISYNGVAKYFEHREKFITYGLKLM